MKMRFSNVALRALTSWATRAARARDTTTAAPRPVPLTDAEMGEVAAGAGKRGGAIQILRVMPSSGGKPGDETPNAGKGGASIQV